MKKWILILLGCLSCSIGQAEIIPADSLDPIEKEIEHADADTLVLIDIGGTLIAHPDAVTHAAHNPKLKQWFRSYYPNITREETIFLIDILEGDLENWILLDAKWPDLIAKAQKNQAKVIAFTKFFKDSSLKKNRLRKLEKFHLDFKNDLPELVPTRTFDYENGVIITEETFKGTVLKEVLAQLSYLPKKIIFVDDHSQQIQSIEEACKDLGIPCVTFHYIAHANPPPLNEAAMELQLRTLVEQHRWLSDNEALELLNHAYEN